MRLAAAALLLLAAGSPAPQTFRHAGAGFSLSIPGAWRAMPDSVVREISSMATRATGTAVTYVAGYQVAGSERWGEFPYVLIQVGETPPVSEEDFVRMMTGSEGRERIQRAAEQMQGPTGLAGIDLREPTWDAARHNLWLPSHARGADGREVHGLSALRLSRRGFVGIHYYDSQAEGLSEALAPVAATLSFDPDAAYDPAKTGRARGESIGRMVGGLLGALVAFGAALAWRKRRTASGAGTIGT